MKPAVRKTIVTTLWIVVIVIFALMTFVFISLPLKAKKDGYESVLPLWNVWYYVFSIISSFGTVAAVFVALFKEEIMRRLNSPELIIMPFDDVEVETEKDSQGQILSYKYCLVAHNKGPVKATGISVSYTDFKYDIKRLRKTFDTVRVHTIPEISKELSIYPGDSLRIPLFQVSNPAFSKSPDGNNVSASISFEQLSVEEKATYGAVFRVSYRIRCSEIKDILSSCEIDWSGEWSDESQQMKNNITVKTF